VPGFEVLTDYTPLDSSLELGESEDDEADEGDANINSTPDASAVENKHGTTQRKARRRRMRSNTPKQTRHWRHMNEAGAVPEVLALHDLQAARG
jgi:hypothetical protein